MTTAWAILLLVFSVDLLGGCAQSRFVCSWPVEAPRITQDYGCYTCMFTGKHHSGMDLTSALEPVGSLNTRVFAAADGKVLLAHGNCSAEGDRSCGGGLGNHLLIGHDNGYSTLYAHLDRLRVHQGDRVVRGGVIGNMGSSGNASGVHLHFDLLAFTPANLNEIGPRYTGNLPEENGHLDPKECVSHKVLEITEATTVLERPVSYHIPSPEVITTLAVGQLVTSLAESSGGWHYIYLPSTGGSPKTAYGWVQGAGK